MKATTLALTLVLALSAAASEQGPLGRKHEELGRLYADTSSKLTRVFEYWRQDRGYEHADKKREEVRICVYKAYIVTDWAEVADLSDTARDRYLKDRENDPLVGTPEETEKMHREILASIEEDRVNARTEYNAELAAWRESEQRCRALFKEVMDRYEAGPSQDRHIDRANAENPSSSQLWRGNCDEGKRERGCSAKVTRTILGQVSSPVRTATAPSVVSERAAGAETRNGGSGAVPVSRRAG